MIRCRPCVHFLWIMLASRALRTLCRARRIFITCLKSRMQRFTSRATSKNNTCPRYAPPPPPPGAFHLDNALRSPLIRVAVQRFPAADGTRPFRSYCRPERFHGTVQQKRTNNTEEPNREISRVPSVLIRQRRERLLVSRFGLSRSVYSERMVIVTKGCRK